MKFINFFHIFLDFSGKFAILNIFFKIIFPCFPFLNKFDKQAKPLNHEKEQCVFNKFALINKKAPKSFISVFRFLILCNRFCF